MNMYHLDIGLNLVFIH